jgi:hypothetical protein
LTRCRRIAANIAKLPRLLGAPQQPEANPLIQRRQAQYRLRGGIKQEDKRLRLDGTVAGEVSRNERELQFGFTSLVVVVGVAA